jgi:hypothetical protein
MGARCHVGDKNGGLKVHNVSIAAGQWGHVATWVTKNGGLKFHNISIAARRWGHIATWVTKMGDSKSAT